MKILLGKDSVRLQYFKNESSDSKETSLELSTTQNGDTPL